MQCDLKGISLSWWLPFHRKFQLLSRVGLLCASDPMLRVPRAPVSTLEAQGMHSDPWTLPPVDLSLPSLQIMCDLGF